MELLKPTSSASKIMEIVISDNTRRLRDTLNCPDDMADAACAVYRAQMLKNYDQIQAATKRWRDFAEHPDFAKISDSLYYAIRGGKIYAIDYPYNYLDVYPYVTKETTKAFIQKINGRNRIAEHLSRNHGITGLRFGPAALNMIEKRVGRVAKEIKKTLPEGNEITFHFDGRRILKKTPMPSGHIHMFNVFYQLGWEDKLSGDWDELVEYARATDYKLDSPAKLTASCMELNYKIMRDICFDVIHDVLIGASAHVWIAEDHMASVSYMLVRLGNSLCNRRINIVFEENYETLDEWRAASLRGQFIIAYKTRPIIPVADIQAVLAIYLLHHEIYFAGANVSSVPTFLPRENYKLPTSPLFLRLDEIFTRFHKRWTTPEDISCPEEEIERLAGEIAADWAEGDQFIVVAAIPGTGKTTYTRQKPDYKIINSDTTMGLIKLGGVYLRDVLARKGAEVDEMCAGLPRRLREVVTTTLKYEVRRNASMPYRNAARRVENRLIARRTNIIYETPDLSRFSFYDVVYDNNDCENAPRAPIPQLLARATEIVLFYNSLEKIYVQQLNRSLEEHRALGYYREAVYYSYLVNTDFAEHKHKATIYGLDDSREMHLIVSRGVLDEEKLRKYSAKNKAADLHRLVAQFRH